MNDETKAPFECGVCGMKSAADRCVNSLCRVGKVSGVGYWRERAQVAAARADAAEAKIAAALPYCTNPGIGHKCKGAVCITCIIGTALTGNTEGA